MNTRRFQFRTADLFLMTVVVALTVAAAKVGPIGAPHSPILLVLLAGMLGAVTGRVASDDFRFGFVGGLLLGGIGYVSAVFVLSSGIRISNQTLFFICVCAGGVIGGLIPMTLRGCRQMSVRWRRGILLVVVGLSVVLALRWQTVSKQTRAVAELQAAGALVHYSDINPFPSILDSRRMVDSHLMQSRSKWLRKLLGLRVVRDVILTERVDHQDAIQLLIEELPRVEDLRVHADQMDDGAFALLNSGQLSRLENLRFSGRGCDDATLSRLQPLPDLLVLDLYDTSVTDASIERIAAFPRLVALDARETDITKEGVQRLTLKIDRVLASN